MKPGKKEHPQVDAGTEDKIDSDLKKLDRTEIFSEEQSLSKDKEQVNEERDLTET